MLLAGAALAGCVAEDPQGPASEAPVVVSDPRDYSYLIDNNTTGAHLHDYWGGAHRLPIVSEAQYVGITWNGPPRSMAEFLPPDDVTVPMGTAHVEVTMTWEDDGDDEGIPELWLRTANDSTERKVAELQSGRSVVVNVTNDDNDLPHQLLSAWEFHFYLRSPDGERIEFSSEVDTQVWAERGLPIPLFPAHPDQWNGTDEIDLFDSGSSTLLYYGDTEGSQNCYSGCMETHDPVNRSVVPLDADHVTFTVTYEPDSTRLEFFYHPSDTREWTLLEDDEDTDPLVDTYTVPVEGVMGDGPYATQSLWRVRLATADPVEPGIVCGYCESVPFTGSYTLEATVSKDA